MSAHTKRKIDSVPLFKPFEWVPPKHQADTGPYFVMSTIRDLASGVCLALQLVERAALQTELGEAPLIDDAASKRLTRMSIAVMTVIEDYVDEHLDEMFDRGAPLGQAKQGAAS